MENVGHRLLQVWLVYAFRFVSQKLGLQAFAPILHGPIVRAWLAAGKWDGQPPKEALPVHFTAVRALEAAVSPDVEDSWLTIEVDKESVRGWAWRSKTCPHAASHIHLSPNF